MTNAPLPFDTAFCSQLPISAFIYEPVYAADKTVLDYRIVYGNAVFARDWQRIYRNDAFLGSLVVKDRLLDDYSLRMMADALSGKALPFSTYLPAVDMHLHFQPISFLPRPYCGFFLTDITDYEVQDEKRHFLRTIRQMKNVAVLLKVHEGGRLESVFVSDGYARMMECSAKEALQLVDGEGFFNVVVPEDRELVKTMFAHRVSDDGGTTLTIRNVTAKGLHIWCNVHYAFIDDFNEHYVYCTYFNVTVLKTYEERLRGVYNSLGDNFYRLADKMLGLFRVNLTRDEIEDIRGTDLYSTDSTSYRYSESLELRAMNYPIASEQAQFLELFNNKRLCTSYLEGKVSESQVFYSQRRDGRMCFVNYSATLTRHPVTGDIIAFITEMECNSEKVDNILLDKILVQQFDMVCYLANGRYGVVIGDAARIRQGSIFPTTRSGNYTRYLESQVIPVLSGTAEYRESVAKALSLESIEAELKVREPYVVNVACDIDGETYYKRFDFYLVDPDAKFYILLKSDTTAIQREQLERNEQLRLALDEAKQASVAKTAFLSSMSHEIRTPMNAIIGLDNIALKEPDLSERTKEHLEKIGLSARHLLSLINDILDMSRIESGRMTLKNEDFSFRCFLDQINTLINSQCQDKGLHYDCVVRGKVEEHYIGDAMKLKQVLINILGNSVKFTNPPDGKVSFSVECKSQFEGQSTLRFVIKDTGIGMDADFLPKLFDAFSQEDATTTNKYGGSGLGLAITKNIVEMMNGTIAVESTKGKGTVFTVDVPLRDAGHEALRRQDYNLNPHELRVLIIDDDPIALQHAHNVLEEVGISSDTCLGGVDALEMIKLHHARHESYNLILVDLKMPVQNGIEVTKKIRDVIGNESAIVILTAYTWADVETDAVLAGVDGFMSKPLFASNVLYEFQQAMQRKQVRAPDTDVQVELSGRRILLAEDMPINAEIMMELLKMKGLEVEHAENGKLAVDAFAASAAGYFDAVLMDVRMPVMDGLAAASAIRALDHPDAKSVPIIAMTANAFDEDVQRSLQAGMDAHLTKPVESDRLYETLASLIGRREATVPQPPSD